MNSQKEHWEVQFESELISVLKSSGQSLPNYTRAGALNGSAEVSWKVLGTGPSQKNREPGTKIQSSNLAHTVVKAKLDNYEKVEPINLLDEFKSSGNFRRGYAEDIISTFMSDADTAILEAGLAATTVQTGSGYAKIDKALLAELKSLASKNNWKGRTGDWVLVITPEVEDPLLQISEVLSRDENPNDFAFVNGKVTRIYNFDIVVSNELFDLQTNTDATQVDCLAWMKPAMGYMVGSAPAVRVDFNPETIAHQVTGTFSCCAGGILGNGIIKVRVDSDAV